LFYFLSQNRQQKGMYQSGCKQLVNLYLIWRLDHENACLCCSIVPPITRAIHNNHRYAHSDSVSRFYWRKLERERVNEILQALSLYSTRHRDSGEGFNSSGLADWAQLLWSHRRTIFLDFLAVGSHVYSPIVRTETFEVFGFFECILTECCLLGRSYLDQAQFVLVFREYGHHWACVIGT